MAAVKITFATAALALVTLVAGFYWLGWLRFSYPDPQKFPIRGIDVSHHQGIIDWPRLKGQGIRFVYIKASEGGDVRDPLYAKNAREAEAAGFRVGAYHYFTFCAPAARQAQNFLAAASARGLSLPPAVDLEYVGNCDRRPTRAEFKVELRTFLRILAARVGARPILYVTRAFYTDYLSHGAFAVQPLWAREIIGNPNWVGAARVLFHQYADNMRFEGISGPVDTEVFLGTPADFERLRPAD